MTTAVNRAELLDQLAEIRACKAEAWAEVQRGNAWAQPQVDKLIAQEDRILAELYPQVIEDAREATIAEYRRQQETVVARLHRGEQAS